ncbi:MAG: hypothetical protein HY927_14615 [Elusimicrobia bacterium]|nr:hypothetical protein [Elusimicrobiota bacterium]
MPLRRRIPLAPVLLGAWLGGAAAPPLLSAQDDGALPPPVVCDQARDGDQVVAALNAALDKVDACLEGINPDLARRIRQGDRAGAFRLYCAAEAGTHGARTVHRASGGADIFINLRPGGKAGQFPLEQRVFHELMHAVDPGDRYLISPEAHGRVGSPDAVYGCHFACYPGGMHDEDALEMRNHGLAIPERAEQPCEGSSPLYCAALRRYAHLCRAGRPHADAAQSDQRREANVPACVMDKILNACRAPACRSLQDEIRTLTDDGSVPIPQGRAAELLRMRRRIAAALEGGDASGLDDPELPLYEAARRSRYRERCLEGR